MVISNTELEVLRECKYNKYDIGLVSDQAYMSIVLTNKCNRNCFYCINSQTDKTLELDIFPAFVKIKNCVEKYGIKEVVILGGEPLLHPRLFDFIKMLKTLGLRKIGLTTNGDFLNQGMITDLAKSGIDFINISIDNFSVRKLSEYKEFYSLFKKFNEKLKVRVNTNVYRGNHDKLFNLLAFVTDLYDCCDEIRISNLIFKDSFSVNSINSEESLERIMSNEEYIKLFKDIQEYYEWRGFPIIINKKALGFVEYAAIMATPIIILNKNIDSDVSKQVCENDIEEKKIHTFKCLVSGDISLSWNTNNVIM
jgi:MoaA/NifB/PqqE/SkfB family radical SAM enzyme